MLKLGLVLLLLTHVQASENGTCSDNEADSSDFLMAKITIEPSTPWVTEQGWCREEGHGEATYTKPGSYGGYCNCAALNLDREGCAKLAETTSATAVEYHAKEKNCFPAYLDKAAPTDCPAGCQAAAGTVTMGAQMGNGDPDTICMVRTITQQGWCREEYHPDATYGKHGRYGGYCNCAALQLEQAECAKLGWKTSTRAVEYHTQRKLCFPAYLDKEAPTDCPAQCHGGVAGTATMWSQKGNGHPGVVCMMKAWTVHTTTQQGWCREEGHGEATYTKPGSYGGYCNCAALNLDREGCAKLAKTTSATAVEYHAKEKNCFPAYVDKAAPTDCPAGCQAAAGTVTMGSQKGNGDPDTICIVKAR